MSLPHLLSQGWDLEKEMNGSITGQKYHFCPSSLFHPSEH